MFRRARRDRDGLSRLMGRAFAAALVVLGGLPGGHAAWALVAAAPAQVERVRFEADGDATRVIVMLSRSVPHELRVLPGEPGRGSRERLVIDFSNARLGPAARVPIGAEFGILQRIRTGQFTARTARVVLDLDGASTHEVRTLDNPARLVVDVAAKVPGTATAAAPAARGGATSGGGTGPRGARERPAPIGDSLPRAEVEASSPVTPAPAPPVAPPAPGGAPASALREAAPHGVPPPTGDRAAARPAVAPMARAETTTLLEEPLTAEPRGGRAADGAGEGARDAGTGPGAQPEAERRDPPQPSVARRAATTPWRIVLDPGHGGNDPGARGVDGVLEKDVTLQIARRVKERLETELRATVLLTRETDVTRSLADRTAFANASRADLFISIHANADAAGRLRGIETYTLNNSNDRATMRLAKMENGPQLRLGRGDLSFILSDMVQSSKEEDSIALAQRLHSRLLSQLRARYSDVRNLGVKKGPFYVLVGAYMPCVLIETSFLSHPVEGKRLASEDYQAEIAEGLYLGVRDFLDDARLAKTL